MTTAKLKSASSPALVALLLALPVLLAALFSCAEPQQPTLEVTPTNQTLTSGATVQLTVTRRFPGGEVDDVTTNVAYSTSDALIATVDANGILTAQANAGPVLIRAYDQSSDATGVSTFTVAEPKVMTIDVEPTAIAIPVGTSRPLTANGAFTNQVNEDITAQVIWSSEDETVATVDGKGNVTAISPGETDVIAKDAITGVTGRATVFVEGGAPTLVAIVVTPNPGVVGVGKTLQLAALGVYSDGSSHDVTSEVTWSSSVISVATVDLSGVATGVTAGQTTFTAVGPEPSTAIKGSAAGSVE